MAIDINEILADFEPEEQARLRSEILEATQYSLPRFKPDELSKVLSVLAPEERLKGFAPEELNLAISKLPSEEKKRLLKQLQQELGQGE